MINAPNFNTGSAEYKDRVGIGPVKNRFNIDSGMIKKANKKAAAKKPGVVLDRYQKEGAFYWKLYETNEEYKNHVNKILSFFSDLERGTVLEIGCRDGLICSKLAAIGFDVIGIDPNANAIGLAKEKCKNASFAIVNYMESDHEFDYILCSKVMKEIYQSCGIASFIDKMWNESKKGIVVGVVKSNEPGIEFDEEEIKEIRDGLENSNISIETGNPMYYIKATKKHNGRDL